MIIRIRLKAWGNSLGAVIPRHIVKELALKNGQELEISVRPATDVKRLFGKYPTGNAQETKDGIRAGWRDFDDANH